MWEEKGSPPTRPRRQWWRERGGSSHGGYVVRVDRGNPSHRAIDCRLCANRHSLAPPRKVGSRLDMALLKLDLMAASILRRLSHTSGLSPIAQQLSLLGSSEWKARHSLRESSGGQTGLELLRSQSSPTKHLLLGTAFPPKQNCTWVFPGEN